MSADGFAERRHKIDELIVGVWKGNVRPPMLCMIWPVGIIRYLHMFAQWLLLDDYARLLPP